LVNEKARPFRNYIGHFYARRVRRILPPYLILLIWVAIAFPGPWLRLWYLYLGGMNFLMPLKLANLDFLSPLWSLAVEEQFYLIWPLAVFYLNSRQLIRCAVALLLLAPVLRFACTPFFQTRWAIYMLLPFRMDTLAAGALVALLWPELRKRLTESSWLRARIAWGCASAALVAILTALVLNRHGYTTYGNTRIGNLALYEVTLGLTASAFIVVLIGFGRKALSTWPFVWLGRISYSFYLVHTVALHVCPQFHGLLALAVSIAYATVSWFVVEKPILNSTRPEPALLLSTGKD
jgi:peptidoglycan/LPS O-acetylase OafA/YrhL